MRHLTFVKHDVEEFVRYYIYVPPKCDYYYFSRDPIRLLKLAALAGKNFYIRMNSCLENPKETDFIMRVDAKLDISKDVICEVMCFEEKDADDFEESLHRDRMEFLDR